MIILKDQRGKTSVTPTVMKELFFSTLNAIYHRLPWRKGQGRKHVSNAAMCHLSSLLCMVHCVYVQIHTPCNFPCGNSVKTWPVCQNPVTHVYGCTCPQRTLRRAGELCLADLQWLCSSNQPCATSSEDRDCLLLAKKEESQEKKEGRLRAFFSTYL